MAFLLELEKKGSTMHRAKPPDPPEYRRRIVELARSGRTLARRAQAARLAAARSEFQFGEENIKVRIA